MRSGGPHLVRTIAASLWAALGGSSERLERLVVTGEGALVSPFPVTDFATAAIATAGLAAAELLEASGATPSAVTVDRVLSSAWCRHASSEPLSERRRPPTWADISQEYPTRDGRWLRLHANYAHPRARLLETLGVPGDPEAIARVVAAHDADELEQALVDNGGPAAASRSMAEWAAHPQGRAVAGEPLVEIAPGERTASAWAPLPGRPLAGIRVLDMTRVLAGPTATQLLAGLGAEVLRVEAPDGDERTGGGDHMLGKRWAFLDARTDEGRERLLELLGGADVFVHGYRPGALDRLGLDADARAAARPGLVEATLDAYGWTGPWRERRGFDTLLQFSCGLADATTAWALEDPEHRVPLDALGTPSDASRPRLLPIQALDYGTGFLLAAAALRGLTRRLGSGEGSSARASLARTAAELVAFSPVEDGGPPIRFPLDGPFEPQIFTTTHGPVRRLRFPLELAGSPLFWERPAEPAGASSPVWTTA